MANFFKFSQKPLDKFFGTLYNKAVNAKMGAFNAAPEIKSFRELPIGARQ